MTPSADNILAVYNRAQWQHIEAGMHWYDYAHNFALELEPSNVERASAVIAILSANTSWKANVTMARQAYANRSGEGMGFQNKVDKINRLFGGENPFDVVSGQKIRNFFLTILDPAGDVVPTIDRHAYDIAVGRRHLDVPRSLGKKRYAEIAQCYRDAAMCVGIGAPQMQAITWVTWKDEHNINV